MDAARFWDRAAPRYARQPIADLDAYEHTLIRTAEHLDERMRVLELGCGTGTTALRLAGQVAHLTGTDISPGMIEIAREKVAAHATANVEFAAADIATGRGLARLRPDAVLAFNVLHLVRDLDGALARIAALLPPGGIFVSKTPCLGGLGPVSAGFRVMIGAMQLVRKAPFVGFVSTGDLERGIERAGFEIVERGDFPKRPPRHFVVARKR